jgi:hypothetical protein
MRVTIAHGKSKQEAKAVVEHSIESIFTSLKPGVIEFIDEGKHWSDDTLAFSLSVRLGPLRTPIRGLAIVTDHDVTLDVDLGMLGKLLPEQAAKNQIERKVKGLLT